MGASGLGKCEATPCQLPSARLRLPRGFLRPFRASEGWGDRLPGSEAPGSNPRPLWGLLTPSTHTPPFSRRPPRLRATRGTCSPYRAAAAHRGGGVPRLGGGVPQLGGGVHQLGGGVPRLGGGVPPLGNGIPRLENAGSCPQDAAHAHPDACLPPHEAGGSPREAEGLPGKRTVRPGKWEVRRRKRTVRLPVGDSREAGRRSAVPLPEPRREGTLPLRPRRLSHLRGKTA